MTWTVFTTLVAVTTAADLITKAIAFKNLGMPGTSPGWPVIPNMLWYRTSLNEGALFGLGQGMGWFFITVSVAALIGIVFTVSWLRIQNDTVLIVALASITGGILGNLYDRLGIPGLHWHAPLRATRRTRLRSPRLDPLSPRRHYRLAYIQPGG